MIDFILRIYYRIYFHFFPNERLNVHEITKREAARIIRELEKYERCRR